MFVHLRGWAESTPVDDPCLQGDYNGSTPQPGVSVKHPQQGDTNESDRKSSHIYQRRLWL